MNISGGVSPDTVRPERIVFHPSGFSFLPCILQRQEPIRVEALVPEPPVKGLIIPIICKFSRPNKFRFLLVCPFIHLLGDIIDKAQSENQHIALIQYN